MGLLDVIWRSTNLIINTIYFPTLFKLKPVINGNESSTALVILAELDIILYIFATKRISKQPNL